MKTILFALICGIALYAVLVLMLFFMQRSLLYLPFREKPLLAESAVTDLEEISLTTEDGLVLNAWFLRPPPTQNGLTVLLLHGNAGHIGHRVDKFRRILAAGYGFLFLEYRGYGGNPGSPTESGLHLDARSALEFLATQDIPAEKIVVYGESLGSGIAVQLAAEHQFAAIVLEAPYTSMTDVARQHYGFLPVRWLLRDRYETLTHIHKIKSPLLVIHGEQDDIISVSHGKQLFDSAPEPKTAWFVPDAGHNDLDAFGLEVRLLDYLIQIPTGSHR